MANPAFRLFAAAVFILSSPGGSVSDAFAQALARTRVQPAAGSVLPGMGAGVLGGLSAAGMDSPSGAALLAPSAFGLPALPVAPSLKAAGIKARVSAKAQATVLPAALAAGIAPAKSRALPSAKTAAVLRAAAGAVTHARGARAGASRLKSVLDAGFDGSALSAGRGEAVLGSHAAARVDLKAGVRSGKRAGKAVPAEAAARKPAAPGPVRAWSGRAAARLGRWKDIALDELRFRLTPRKVTVRFKRVTVVDFGGIRVEAAVTTDNIAEALGELGLRLIRFDKNGLHHVVAKDGGSPEAAAKALESHPYVQYASPRRARPARSRRLLLSFNESILVDFGGFYAEVGLQEDDIADLLRAHGLQVVREIEGGRYEAAVPKGIKAKDAAAKLGQESFVKKAELLPSRLRWFFAGFLGLGMLLQPDIAVARTVAASLTAGHVGLAALLAVGIGLFIFNILQARKGWKSMKKAEKVFSAYKHAQDVRARYEALLLGLPGAKLVGLEQLPGGAWSLTVYFASAQARDTAWIASPIEGLAVRKDVAGPEAIERLLRSVR